MATPYLLPKEAATLGASKRLGLNVCRMPASRRRRCCSRAQLASWETENGFVHFEVTQSNAPQREAMPRSVRSAVGKAEFSTGVKRPPLLSESPRILFFVSCSSVSCYSFQEDKMKGLEETCLIHHPKLLYSNYITA